MASPPTANERDVDRQDRVELFLWSGRESDGYFCLEIVACGAVHDYSARFYRQFDDAWAPRGWEHAVKPRPGGYRVEAALSRAALEAMGFQARAGARVRAGLFRADFAPSKPDAPDWITWVDARTAQPDFHVAGAFGRLDFQPPKQRRLPTSGMNGGFIGQRTLTQPCVHGCNPWKREKKTVGPDGAAPTDEETNHRLATAEF